MRCCMHWVLTRPNLLFFFQDQQTNIMVDLKPFVDSYLKITAEAEQYNGWSNSPKDKIREEKYYQSFRDWSNKMIKKYKIAEQLGAAAYADLVFCFNERRDYNLFLFIVDELEDGTYELLTKSETISIIGPLKKAIEFRRTSFYCCVSFSLSIKELYYSGDAFVGLHQNNTKEEVDKIISKALTDTSDIDFFPELQQQIESFLPKDQFIGDHWESGPTDFSFYWDIAPETLPTFFNKLKAWIKYERLEAYFIHFYGVDRSNKVRFNIDRIGLDFLNKNNLQITPTVKDA